MIAGSPASSCSRKEAQVATSPLEAVYISLPGACKEAMWLERLLRESIPELKIGLVLYRDSHSAIRFSANEALNRRNKHIDIAHLYRCDAVPQK